MSYLADAHRDWHTVNGWNSGCPLDCGACDPGYDDEPWSLDDEIKMAAATRGIPCGHCGHRHTGVDKVRDCSQGFWAPPVPA